MEGFQCRTCGKYHEEMPLAFGPEAPDAWHNTPPEQLTADDELTSDMCVLKGEFFIRGCLDLPIQGSSDVFRWLVWMNVSKEDCLRMYELWEKEGREMEPPFSGRLNTSLPFYPETIGLQTNIQNRPLGERPQVTIATANHPLHHEQVNGLTWTEVQARVEKILH